MNILITGVAGFFGQNLSRALLADGHRIIGVDDLSVGTKEWIPGDVMFGKVDVASMDAVSLINPYVQTGLDLIIHLASRKIPRDGFVYDTLYQNTQMIQTVHRIASMHNAKVIFFSTSDVYGKSRSRMFEDSELVLGHPSISRWSYAASKIWCEQYLYSTRLDFNILRIFGSYGPYHALNWTAGPQSIFISQALKGERFSIHGDGTQRRCFSYVDDIVDGVMRLIARSPSRQIINLGNPREEINILDLAETINSLINGRIDPDIRYTSQLQSGKDNDGKTYEEIPYRIPEIEKARALLGLEPTTSLTEGLKKTIEWQKTVLNLNG